MRCVAEWQQQVPATLEAIEEFCHRFQQWRERYCQGLDAFATELLLREALTNSVVHGCGLQARHRVECRIRARPHRLTIAIKDPGCGFDWKSRWRHDADVSDTHGRGMQIMRGYATRVRFNRPGNGLTLIKEF